MTAKRIWVASELYWPEMTSTGRILTCIAEDLAQRHDVHVLCAQPNYDAKGAKAASQEVRNRVHITRCASTTLDRNKLPFRAINAVTLTLSILLKALSSFKKGDTVLVVTNPPLLPFLVSWSARLRGAKCVLLVHDIYPESLSRAGLVPEGNWLYKLIDRASAKLLSRMERIVVIGRDVPPLLEARLKNHGRRIPPMDLAPNYGDVEEVKPVDRDGSRILAEEGLADKFVLQYAGNMGRTHGLPSLLEGLEALKSDPGIHFVFVGSGAFKKKLEAEKESRGLANVSVNGYRPIQELSESLGACDAALITFSPRMEGVSVPSRMYNVMAAARPILAVCGESSELAMVIKEHQIGWIVAPDDATAFAAKVKEISKLPREELEAMGARAREAVEKLYTPRHTFDKMEASLVAASESP